jgi:preprotein translocase subunit SecF
MTKYEALVAVVALTNLVLALFTFFSNRAKAGADKLAALEKTVRTDLQKQAEELQELRAIANKALNEDHLKDVYNDLKGIAGQVNRMVGEQEQMNHLLRQLLSRQMKP